MIVPGQMLLAEVIWAQGVRRIDDVPVLDGLAALIKLTEALVQLRKSSGMVVTRRDFRWAMPVSEVVTALEGGHRPGEA